VFKCLLLVLLWSFCLPAWAARDQQQLEALKQQERQVQRTLHRLQQQQGTLQSSLHQLDVRLLQARKEHRLAAKAWRQASLRTQTLHKQQQQLAVQQDALEELIKHEAATAYVHRQETTTSLNLWLSPLSWLESMHRRYLLQELMRQQQQHRQAYQQVSEQLSLVLEEEKKQVALLAERLQAKKHAQARQQRLWSAKKQALKRLRSEHQKAKKRQHLLQQEAKALAYFLQQVQDIKLQSAAEWKPVRQLKGHLPWPIESRILHRFATRPMAGMRPLAGVELAPKAGKRQLRAIAAGQVRYASWFGSYGLMLLLDHGDGVVSLYGHNSVLYKHVGDWVAAGEVLADVGSTGCSPAASASSRPSASS